MRFANLLLRAYRSLALQSRFRSHLRVTSRGGQPFIVATSDAETFAVAAASASIHVVPIDDGSQFAVQLRETGSGRSTSLFNVPAADGFNLLAANAMLNRTLDPRAARPWRNLTLLFAAGAVLFLLSAMYTGIKRLPVGPSVAPTVTAPAPATSASPLAMAGFALPTQPPAASAMGASIPASALEALKR